MKQVNNEHSSLLDACASLEANSDTLLKSAASIASWKTLDTDESVQDMHLIDLSFLTEKERENLRMSASIDDVPQELFEEAMKKFLNDLRCQVRFFFPSNEADAASRSI